MESWRNIVRMLQYPNNLPQNRDPGAHRWGHIFLADMPSGGSAVADPEPEAEPADPGVSAATDEAMPSTPVDWVPNELLAGDPGAVSDHTPPPLLTTLLPNVPHWYLNMIDKYYEGDIPDAWLAMLLDDPDHLVMEGLPDHGEIN